MKRIYRVVFLVFFMILVSGCAAQHPPITDDIRETVQVETTPPIMPSPVVTPEPLTEAEMHAAMIELFYDDYGWEGVYRDQKRMTYASFPSHEDWQDNPDYIPSYLYNYPVNIDAANTDIFPCVSEWYHNNKQALDKISPERIAQIIRTATEFDAAEHSGSYRNIKAFRKALDKAWPEVSDKHSLIDQAAAQLDEKKRIHKSVFVTDQSLVYIDINGFFRVRGASYFMAEADKESDVMLNVWYVCECEYVVATTKTVANYRQCEVWKNDTYSVLGSVPLSNGKYYETDEEDVACLTAYLAMQEQEKDAA